MKRNHEIPDKGLVRFQTVPDNPYNNKRGILEILGLKILFGEMLQPLPEIPHVFKWHFWFNRSEHKFPAWHEI